MRDGIGMYRGSIKRVDHGIQLQALPTALLPVDDLLVAPQGSKTSPQIKFERMVRGSAGVPGGTDGLNDGREGPFAKNKGNLLA